MRRLTDINGVALKGGCITERDKSLLPFGAFSRAENIRNTHPGFDSRPGQTRLHTTPDGANKVLSLYQFRKTNADEKHLFAQMSDGDVLEASGDPPGLISGVFGPEVFSGGAGQVPGSWGLISDLMIHSNGVDPHQIFAGTSSAVEKLIVFRGAAAIPDVPQGGEDFSDWIVDANDGKVAVLDLLPAFASHGCLFIRTPVPCDRLEFIVAAANGNAATMSVYYWRNDHTWAAVSGLSDSTDAGGVSLGQSGAVTWTAPTNIMPKYAFGSCGFWYQVRFSAALDSEVELSKVTFGAGWQPIVNRWDGVPAYAVEAQVEGDSQFMVYAAGAIDLDALAAEKKIYIAFADPVEGIYIDPGGTPNAAGTTLTSLKYWNGSAFTTVGTVIDGTSGMSNPGWMTFPRHPAQPHQFGTSLFHAYWYELVWDSAISSDTVVAIQGMPWFDIAEIGRGYCSAVWKDRACYTFDRYGAYIYVTAKDAPLVLNGSNFGILKAGDGRSNRVVAMRKFHNELMVWQEELGVEGGCITLFEGYSPATFGKLLISSRIGTMNAKSVAVVDGVLSATKTDETIKTIAFSLSRYGVCACDGMTVSIVSDDIQNYFDPTKPECIRNGYEKEMWLEYDATFDVIRIGLVSGQDATACNVFPVFDLATKTWSFDTPAQALSCIAGIESGSGAQFPVIMIGGGVDDGTVYQLNVGTADGAEPIRAMLQMVINHRGRVLNLHEIMLRVAARNGFVTLTVRENEREKFSRKLEMSALRNDDSSRRHRFSCEVNGDLILLELSHPSKFLAATFYEIGVGVNLWEQA